MKLKNFISITIASKDKHGRDIDVKRVEATRQFIQERLARQLGGATGVPGIGSWIDNEGLYVTEHVYIIYSFFDTSTTDRATLGATLLTNLEYVRRYLGQASVAYTVNNSMGFYDSADMGSDSDETLRDLVKGVYKND